MRGHLQEEQKRLKSSFITRQPIPTWVTTQMPATLELAVQFAGSLTVEYLLVSAVFQSFHSKQLCTPFYILGGCPQESFKFLFSGMWKLLFTSWGSWASPSFMKPMPQLGGMLQSGGKCHITVTNSGDSLVVVWPHSAHRGVSTGLMMMYHRSVHIHRRENILPNSQTKKEKRAGFLFFHIDHQTNQQDHC